MAGELGPSGRGDREAFLPGATLVVNPIPQLNQVCSSLRIKTNCGIGGEQTEEILDDPSGYWAAFPALRHDGRAVYLPCSLNARARFRLKADQPALLLQR